MSAAAATPAVERRGKRRRGRRRGGGGGSGRSGGWIGGLRERKSERCTLQTRGGFHFFPLHEITLSEERRIYWEEGGKEGEVLKHTRRRGSCAGGGGGGVESHNYVVLSYSRLQKKYLKRKKCKLKSRRFCGVMERPLVPLANATRFLFIYIFF